MSELYHHGILGMKWGIRRYQNPDGSLTEEGRRRYGNLTRRDRRWVNRKSDKVTSKAEKQTKKELDRYKKQLLRQDGAYNSDGKLSAKTINAYNHRKAELMTEKVKDLRSPSGKTIQFVAKRGELGVYMALADAGYDMNQMRNGIWDDGRVAYKKDVVDQVRVKK